MVTAKAHRALLAGLASADIAALALLRPHGAVVHGLASPHRWVTAVGPDTAAAQLVGAALWLVAGWLGVGLGACAASAVPGAVGRCAAWLAKGTLPRSIYRLAAGAVSRPAACRARAGGGWRVIPSSRSARCAGQR